MKKTNHTFYFIIVAVIMIALISVFIIRNQNQLEKTTTQTNATIKQKEPVQWHGNYIWDGSTENNTWMCFRKKINLDKVDSEIIAQIAVDSKYWLYINGEMVIREGALKRGEKKDSIYYDEVNLTSYLKKGENTIAVLVWYWGGESISHVASGQGAFLFQAKNGKEYLMSDETWKVARNKAFEQDEFRPNNRLIEYNVVYNASLAEENWFEPDYDDTTWENAKILGEAGSMSWGEMIERPIPQFKNETIKEYENMMQYKNYTTTKALTLAMKLPYNVQLTPYLKVEAPKGLEIMIKTDTYEDVNGDSVRCRYITKEGEQEFESFAWMNGEVVYYTIPEGVKIISLGYRETGYDTQMVGNFSCDNDFFNQLWKMADRTLYVNMRDSYMDCPNRERAQWWGDVNIEMMQAMYALDTSTYDLYEKGVRTMMNWKEDDILLTVVPSTLEMTHLPVQMLAGVQAFYEYYEYTGKKEFLEYVYPHTKKYLALWKMDDNGLMKYSKTTGPIWRWGDSVAECDYTAIENVWYYFALGKLEKMAEILEYEEDRKEIDSHLQKLKTNLNQLWTKNGYQSADSTLIDERANAVAVLSGLADEEKYPVIKHILTTSYQATPCMEKYVLEALCEMGYTEEAQKRIEDRYDEMVNGKNACSTLWENWNYEIGTKNHAWAGGPLIIMSKYFAGIEPLEKGYETISIKPQFGKLNEIHAKVNTVKGNIELMAEKTKESMQLKITTPTKTRVAIPKISENFAININGNTIYENGTITNPKDITYDSEDEKFIYFYVEKGKYEIKVDTKIQ